MPDNKNNQKEVSQEFTYQPEPDVISKKAVLRNIAEEKRRAINNLKGGDRNGNGKTTE